MSWPPDTLFRAVSEQCRPLGQGDIYRDVPVAGKTAVSNNGDLGLKAKRARLAVVVGSSCGMRKAADGALTDVLHVAPISELRVLVPSWSGSPPFDPSENLAVMPLPGLPDEPVLGANLARIGLTATAGLSPDKRVASMTVAGLAALKTRVSTYFTRNVIPVQIAQVGAEVEYAELELWSEWVHMTGDESGFQPWLDEANRNFEGRTRRETLYDDLEGIRGQLMARLTD